MRCGLGPRSGWRVELLGHLSVGVALMNVRRMPLVGL